MAFNVPNSLKKEDTYTGCPPGYILVGDACVNPLTSQILELTEAAAYEFEYYQIAGELVGRYVPFAVGDPVVAPTFFNQNARVHAIKHFNLPKLRQNINIDDSVFFFSAIHSVDEHGEVTAKLTEAFYNPSEDFRNTFNMGEFFFLSNSLKSIKRMNLNYDLVQEDKPFGEWDKAIPGDSDLPSSMEGDLDSFVEWYFGYSKIPNGQRPSNMIGELKPTISEPVYATENLQWETLRPDCYTWIRVYDQSNPSELLADENLRFGQYLCQMRAVINEAKLEEFIKRNADASLYADSSKDFNVIIYPPSFYMYPGDAVTEIDTPSQNAVNDYFKEVIFEVSDNYKIDGNIHYNIQFLTAKNSEDILFETSTYGEDPSFEEFHWYASRDKKNWDLITSRLPTFDNVFQELNGSDSETALYIKYELSDRAKDLLTDRADILFKINQLDGTLIK